MGDNSRFDAGDDIIIRPPLTWGQIKGTKFLDEASRDAHLVIDSISKDTETGTETTKTCMFIIAAPGTRKHYNIVEEIREIIAAFPEHKFEGLLKAVSEGFDADDTLWGVQVENNVVSRIKPDIVWPGEDR